MFSCHQFTHRIVLVIHPSNSHNIRLIVLIIITKQTNKKYVTLFLLSIVPQVVYSGTNIDLFFTFSFSLPTVCHLVPVKFLKKNYYNNNILMMVVKVDFYNVCLNVSLTQHALDYPVPK